MMALMNEPTPIMTIEEWAAFSDATTTAMAAYVPSFITPVIRVISFDEGELHGSGSYVAIDGATYLLTNEHVAAASLQRRLAHMFHGSDEVITVRGHFASISLPTDAAIARVDMSEAPAAAAAVTLSLYAPHHQTVDGELLFIAGYPGQRSQFAFNTLFSPHTPYLTQEDAEQSQVLGAHHFAVPWRPDQARSVEPRSPGLSLPPGMSGSLVWNTRRVEFHQSGRPWSPQEARVTGLVFAWSTCANWVYVT